MRLGNRGQRFFVIDYETTGLAPDSVPIEVGVVVCDETFTMLETFQSLIKPPTWLPANTWDPKELGAYRVHGIMPTDFSEMTPPLELVGQWLHDLAKRHTSRTGQKPVLVSDNVQFEWKHTQALLGSRDWPFHYCGWDTSLFLEAAGVGDPKPAHRAMADAGLLHAAILKALDRTRGLR